MKKALLLLLFLASFSGWVSAQNPGELDVSFNAGDIQFLEGGFPYPSSISSMWVQSDGKILAVGSFNTINGFAVTSAARFNADGSRDASFNPAVVPDFTTIDAIREQPDGKILMAGIFSSVNGVPANRMVRLNSDGSVDPTFNIGSGPNNTVSKIEVRSDGKIIVIGDFTIFNGLNRQRYVLLNSNGTDDSTYTPSNLGATSMSDVAVQPDGKILVSGEFSNAVGRIARFNADGTRDTSFNPGFGANNRISEIKVADDGKIYISGAFTNFDGISRNRIARLNSNGTLDTSFNPGTGFDGSVGLILIYSSDKIIAGGTFSSYNGTAATNLVSINSDGSRNTQFNFGTGANRTVSDLKGYPDGKILISGAFTTYNGTTRVNIARIHGISTNQGDTTPPVPNVGTLAPIQSQCGINADELIAPTATDAVDGAVTATTDLSIFPLNQVGSTLITWTYRDAAGNESTQTQEIIITGNSQGLGEVDCSLNFKALYSEGGGAISPPFASTGLVEEDGRFYVGGVFNRFDGIEIGNIARFFPDGTRDESFVAQTDGQVYVMTKQADGKLLLGGNFSQVNGQTIQKLVRLNEDGSVDDSFQTGTGFTGLQFNTLVRNIAVQKDGKIVVVGDFNGYNSVPVNAIVRLNPDGSLDSSFVPGVPKFRSGLPLGIQEDGKIVFGANVSPDAFEFRLFRLNPDGSADPSISATLIGQAWDLTIQDDQKIVIVGPTSFNGTTINGIARINRDGSLDTSFNTGGGFPPSFIRTVFSRRDRGLFVGGGFTTYNGQPANRIVAINPDGSLDTRYDFGLGANGNVQKVLQQSDGKLLAIGSFTRFDGEKRSGAVRIHGVLDEVAPRAAFDVVATISDKGIMDLGDLDGDRDLDFSFNSFSQLAGFFENDGTGAFSAIDQQIGVQSINTQSPWGDYDGDGDLDFFTNGLVDGTLASRIYQNNGPDGFIDIQANLIGLRQGTGSWGDFDNDGDLDLAVIGDLSVDQGTNLYIPITKLYKNEGDNQYAEVEAGFEQLHVGNLNWVDYDLDGDLDLFVSGNQANGTPLSKLYRNDGADTFTEVVTSIPGFIEPAMDWGDYDSDGDLDLFISGRNSSWQAFSRLYRNDGGDVFTPVNLNIQPHWAGMIKWGDFDNDGDLDLLSSGIDFTQPTEEQRFISRVYRNQGSDVFEELPLNLELGLISRGGWADLDGDGDLDIAISGLNSSYQLKTRIYLNNHVENGGSANAKPTAPLNLVSTPNPADQKMRLEWELASDAETPVNSLSYNLFIRDVGSSNYSKTPEALESDGWRLLPALGNASLNTFYEWNYSEADKGKTFEWSVQAIDGALSGGEFAESGFFTLDNTPPTLVNQSGTFDTDASRAFTQADLSADDDESPADQLVYTVKSLPVAGTLSFDGAAAEIGQIFTQADIAAGKLSYQNTVNTARTDSFTFTVTDLFLNETEAETFSITLNDKTPPVAVAQNLTVILGATNGQGSITPQQVNNGSSDNFTSGANLILSLNRTNFSCSDIGNTPTVILTVTDENGNSSTATATVTVLDQTAPTLSLRNITLDLNASGLATLTASNLGNSRDNCGIASFTLSKTQFTCADVGVVEVVVTATDLSGNSATGVALVTVRDRTNPVFVNLPNSISVTLPDGEPYVIPDFRGNVTDNCGINSYTQSIPAGTVTTTAGTSNVTINVADASGNTARATVRIVRTAPRIRRNGARLDFQNPELVTVPWNTAFEEVISGIEVEGNLALSWIEDGYDRLTPGMYQVKAMSSPQVQARFSSTPVLNILVLDKPKALDIELSSKSISNQLRAGDQIGLLSTVDSVDDIHTYRVEGHPDMAVEGNRLIWKGTGMPDAEMKLTVFSTDRAGQTISKDITLFRELKIGEFLIYPNPAEDRANVLVELDQPSQVSLSVFDAVGRMVISDQFSRETTFVQTLDLNGLAPGMYTVQIQVGKMVMTGRLIKK